MTELPMLASASTGASGRLPVTLDQLVDSGDWTFDLKLDGERAFLFPDGRIVNRKGVDITHRFPEIINHTGEWLDGEIVALDGSFETVLSRGGQENRAGIARGAVNSPCRFVAFDLPGHATQPWLIRRDMLETLASNMSQAITVVSRDRDFFDHVRDLGMEGVIAKRNSSRYQFGRRSKDWVKFKTTRRITCVVTGYSPGTGSREHMGAIHLALINGDSPVSVGRCGSGFTAKQTHDLKTRLDAGELLAVEIECLSLTSGGTLRFPVFRGIRFDKAIHECTYDQLDELPRC